MFRRNHHISTGIALALTLTIAAVAPCAASARPYLSNTADLIHPAPEVHLRSPHATNAAVASIQAQGARVAHELAARDAANGPAVVTFPPPKIVKIFQHNRFLVDAMIGAGAMLGLVLVLLGSSVYTIHRGTLRINRAR